MMMEKLACLSPTEAVALRNSPTILQMMLKDAQCAVFSSVDCQNNYSSVEKKSSSSSFSIRLANVVAIF